MSSVLSTILVAPDELLPRSERIGFFRDGRLDQARLREERPIAVLCLSEAMTI